MSRIGNNGQSVLIRQIANNRTEMNDLQRQLASGKVGQSYGELGSRRTTALALRQEMSHIEGFRKTISTAQTRIKVMDATVSQLRGHATSMRSELLLGGYEPSGDGQTLAQKQASARLTDTVDLLNTDIAGRSLFSGMKTDELPVRPASELMDGIGGKAGFRQIMDERRQADLGTDGKGRLALAATSATQITLSEDIAGSPFGFKIGSVNSGLSGVTAAGPAGAPAVLSIDFSATLPTAGEQFTVSLNMPDGTSKDLSLTAGPVGEQSGANFAIGVDAATTATNFQNALSTLLSSEAESTLVAASMQVAADDFFVSGTDTPQRVDGPPFDSATGLRDATVTDTVTWYTGDKSDKPARESALARVDDNTVVAYGARADEGAFGNLIKQLAIMSSATFSGDVGSDYVKYTAMTDRVSDNLNAAVQNQSIDRIAGEIAIAQNRMGEAELRHGINDDMVTGFLADIETTDLNEVATRLLAMQTQLQASYQVTGMLSGLSLANYI